MNNIIRKVINTLDCIEVKGRNNMNMLLGCIQALEEVCDSLEASRQEESQEKEEEA